MKLITFIDEQRLVVWLDIYNVEELETILDWADVIERYESKLG